MAQTQAENRYGGVEVGEVKIEAAATIDITEGVNVSAMGSLVNGEVYIKIPIIFTESSLKIGAEGYLFGAGAEFVAVYGEEKKIKIGVSAVVGGAISISLEDN
jgi:hypothetical protein